LKVIKGKEKNHSERETTRKYRDHRGCRCVVVAAAVAAAIHSDPSH
jgi:hypothetical protein